jgi:hypothetical protein
MWFIHLLGRMALVMELACFYGNLQVELVMFLYPQLAATTVCDAS